MPVLRGADLRVADVVREHASARPTTVAVKQGDRELTYAMLDERSNRLAQALLANGARPGSRIAYLDRSAPEIVELVFAASKIGAVAVPLNWRLAVPELRLVLEDSSAPILIAGPEYEETAADVAALAPGGSAGRPRCRRSTRSGSQPTSAVDPGGTRRGRRCRAAALHVGHDRRAEGRPHDPPQPGGVRGDVALLAVRRRHRLRDAAADVPHRRHRLDVPRPLERCDDDPRARVRARGGARSPRARARDERDLRADDAADADGGAGRRPSRLLGSALDRLRSLARSRRRC